MPSEDGQAACMFYARISAVDILLCEVEGWRQQAGNSSWLPSIRFDQLPFARKAST
jgi:hypothetical protein